MTSVEDALTTADAYLAVDRNERAAQILTAALVEHPDHADLLTELSRAQLRMGAPELAMYTAHSALRVAPGCTAAMRMYALALSGIDEREAAAQVAYRAVVSEPNDYLTHYTYAIVLAAGWQYQTALLCVEEALRLQPASADVHFQRGLILQKLGRISESDAAYAEALRLDPDHSAAMHNMALNGLKRGRWTTALSGFLGAARMDPKLGDLVRGNVGAALRMPLRWTTLAGVVVCFFAGTIVAGSREAQQVPYRLAGAASLLGLIVLLGWVFRAARIIPRRAWPAVLKRRPMLVLRILVSVASVAVAIPANLGVQSMTLQASAVALLVLGLIITIVGWKEGS